MWTSDLTLMMLEGVRDTLLMTLMSTLFGYLLGLPWGIVLAVTDKSGIRPNVVIYKILDVVANIMRSIPFLILLILVMPITRAIVGKTTGSAATIVPLTLAAAPFIGRMIEWIMAWWRLPRVWGRVHLPSYGRCFWWRQGRRFWWALPLPSARYSAIPPWQA